MNPAATSAEDTSVAPVRDRAMEVPSLTDPGALNVAVGATLATVAVNEAESESPSLSVTVTVTV